MFHLIDSEIGPLRNQPRTVVLKVWLMEQQNQQDLETCLEMQILRIHPRPPAWEPLWVGPKDLCFNKSPGDSDAHSNLKTTAL